MVGVSDIPCVGKAVDRLSDAAVAAVLSGLRYMLCYNSVVKDLNSKIEDVTVQEDRVSRKVIDERNNGKTIQDHVVKWQKQVEDVKTLTDELSRQTPSCNCFNVVMFPDLLTRFRLGRKAAHEAKHVAELTASGEQLLANEIAYLPADENIPLPDTTYQKFESREEAYRKLWEALVKEDGHPIIGIYGMPGVGKTRMMEQAWEDAKDKNIFEKVIRANVGAGNIDVTKLQNQLAGFLGCHLEWKDSEARRASQLKNSLINGGNTLIILDDVWDNIRLQDIIGIKLGDDIPKGCKILLTSRRENICLRNQCKDPIKVNTLMVGEAWDMFKNTVGAAKIESLLDTSLAYKVCNKCGGLPLLIQALANALKHLTEDSWKDALSQLENCNLEEIDGTESSVYTCIKLSFDKLPEAEKTCLLLCSLFAEDADIEINMLEEFAKGSQLLNRERYVRGLLDNLKSSSLLLEGKTHRTVKLHDIIRDVARSIAVRDDQYAFLFIRGGSCLPDFFNYGNRRLLHSVDSDNFRFPTGMVCPDLHTLWLERNNKPQQFSNTFFEGIGNLKILVLKGMHIYPEKISVQTFDNLDMLILDGCDLKEVSLSIVPENLEILRILECCIPNPIDLPKLKSLRKLEVLSHSIIEMAPNAISTLAPTLEELHIPGGYRIFDAEDKRPVPISSELNKLTLLTSLTIRLENSESCPAEYIVANLHHFIINVGDKYNSFLSYERTFDSDMRSVTFYNRCIEGGGDILVERAEQAILRSIKGSQNGFSNSKRQAFSTLKKLDIESCHDMNHLFSASVAKCLVQLECLQISYCQALEVIVRNEGTAGGLIINFPKLKELRLRDLESLRRFYGDIRSTSYSSTTIMENAATSIHDGSDCLFDGTVAFPALELLEMAYLKTSDIWGKNCCKSNLFSKLQVLEIRGCDNMEFAIPLAMLPVFQNLEKLKIWECKSMRSVFESSSSSNETSNAELPLLTLRSIYLRNLPSLTQILKSRRRNLYPNLEKLKIEGCKSLKNVFLPSMANDLLHLKKLSVNKCEMVSEIIGEEETDEEKYYEFVFPELTKLTLTELPNFKSFWFTTSVKAEAITRQHQSYSTFKVSFPKLVILDFYVENENITDLKGIELGTDNSTSELKKLVVSSDTQVQLPSKWKLQLSNVEELILQNCWWHESSRNNNVGKSLLNACGTLSFQRLKIIRIYSCRVSALFSCSLFRNLHQLEHLLVSSCRLLKEVVREENNILGAEEETISLLQLNSISLFNLPRLKSFSRSESYAFNMPALKSLTVRECPRMEYFTCLEISMPLILIQVEFIPEMN